jgi:hypothetical protein
MEKAVSCQACFIGLGNKSSNEITLTKALFKQQRAVINAGYC